MHVVGWSSAAVTDSECCPPAPCNVAVFRFRFGVVCAFVTNEYMEDGTQKLPSRLRTSINDTKLYLSNTGAVSYCVLEARDSMMSRCY